jgi:hypothetical protein
LSLKQSEYCILSTFQYNLQSTPPKLFLGNGHFPDSLMPPHVIRIVAAAVVTTLDHCIAIKCLSYLRITTSPIFFSVFARLFLFFPFSLQEERRLSRTAPGPQETPFGIYGPPAAYAPGYF